MTPASTGHTVRAVSLSAPLGDLREIRARGEIMAAFERSAYLDLDGRIIALASADLARGPFTVSIEDFAPIRAVPITSDVSLAGGVLLVGPIAVDLRAASVWNPALPAAGVTVSGRGGALGAARAAAIDELLAGAPEQSIVRLLALPRPLPRGELLAALARGLAAIDVLLDGTEDQDALADLAAREIAGRGPGLTPSGDDLLIGLLHALSVWPMLAPAGTGAALRDLLVDAARPRTTRLSGAYLEAARRGWAAEPWHALVRSLNGSPTETRAAVRGLLQIGETSGADALTGFCWAWRRVTGETAARPRRRPSVEAT